jgi:hypothetical protein
MHFTKISETSGIHVFKHAKHVSNKNSCPFWICFQTCHTGIKHIMYVYLFSFVFCMFIVQALRDKKPLLECSVPYTISFPDKIASYTNQYLTFAAYAGGEGSVEVNLGGGSYSVFLLFPCLHLYSALKIRDTLSSDNVKACKDLFDADTDFNLSKDQWVERVNYIPRSIRSEGESHPLNALCQHVEFGVKGMSDTIRGAKESVLKSSTQACTTVYSRLVSNAESEPLKQLLNPIEWSEDFTKLAKSHLTHPQSTEFTTWVKDFLDLKKFSSVV